MYEPNASITIEGTAVTGATLEGVQITYGKADPTDSFRPAYATATLISDANGINVSIYDHVQIYMEATTGTEIVFTGIVSDINIDLVSADWVETSLTLISPLAKIAHRAVGKSGYPQQLDGERFEAILTDASSVIWTEAGGTWLTQVGTWQDIENIIGTCDAGDKILASYTGAFGTAFDFLGIAELSGMGHAFETRDGKLGYQGAGARINTFIDAVTILGDDVMIDALASEITTGNLHNETYVTESNGHVETAQNLTSIQTYGRITNEVETWLKDHTTALEWAERDVALYGSPRAYVSGFAVRLSAVDSTFADILIKMEMGLPVRIYDLPPALASNPYAGFVEGWQWSISRYDAEIKLFISDYALSVVSQEWKNVPSTYTWATTNNTLIWETLEVIS